MQSFDHAGLPVEELATPEPQVKRSLTGQNPDSLAAWQVRGPRELLNHQTLLLASSLCEEGRQSMFPGRDSPLSW